MKTKSSAPIPEHKETPAYESKMHSKEYLIAALRKEDPKVKIGLKKK